MFHFDGTVVAHRVVQNQYFSEELITKGDANETQDINPVPYRQFIGRVKYHIPSIGPIMMVAASKVGKFYLMNLNHISSVEALNKLHFCFRFLF